MAVKNRLHSSSGVREVVSGTILYLNPHPAGLAGLHRDERGGLLVAEIHYNKISVIKL